MQSKKGKSGISPGNPKKVVPLKALNHRNPPVPLFTKVPNDSSQT